MEKLTTAERHEVYKKVLTELYQSKKNNELFFICVTIRRIVAPRVRVESVLIKFGFDEIFKHKPPHRDYAWFDGFEYAPRIKILKALIEETSE